jgi:exonuclease III
MDLLGSKPEETGRHVLGVVLILCGDINIARADTDVHPGERKPGVIGQRDEERALFKALLGDCAVEVARALERANLHSELS